jgi:hypothetical protein
LGTLAKYLLAALVFELEPNLTGFFVAAGFSAFLQALSASKKELCDSPSSNSPSPKC